MCIQVAIKRKQGAGFPLEGKRNLILTDMTLSTTTSLYTFINSFKTTIAIEEILPACRQYLLWPQHPNPGPENKDFCTT